MMGYQHLTALKSIPITDLHTGDVRVLVKILKTVMDNQPCTILKSLIIVCNRAVLIMQLALLL